MKLFRKIVAGGIFFLSQASYTNTKQHLHVLKTRPRRLQCKLRSAGYVLTAQQQHSPPHSSLPQQTPLNAWLASWFPGSRPCAAIGWLTMKARFFQTQLICWKAFTCGMRYGPGRPIGRQIAFIWPIFSRGGGGQELGRGQGSVPKGGLVSRWRPGVCLSVSLSLAVVQVVVQVNRLTPPENLQNRRNWVFNLISVVKWPFLLFCLFSVVQK